jgi:hypothetical protein
MQPSNPRSEMGSKNPSTPSGNDSGVNPNGKGGTPPIQQQQQQEEPRRLSLAELFADDNNSEGTDSSAEDDLSQPPETMEQLTRRLGLKPEQVYGVKIPLADGAEALTIGQMKDRVAELVDLETRETKFELRRVKEEGEMLRAQAEIRDLLAMVPKEHIKPEMVEKIRKRHDENMNRERQMTLEHIPEWQDEKKRVEDIQGMSEFMSDYGFDKTFLGTVSDHRAIKFIRDMYLRDRRIKAALAKVTTPNTKGQRPSNKPAKGAIKPNMQQSKRSAQGSAPNQRARLSQFFSES